MKRADFKAAARRNLNAIYDYGYEHWGTVAAENYAAMITAEVAFIVEFPLTRPEVEGRAPLRRANVGSHLIFYRPTAEGITVTRVLHQRMDAGRHLS